MGWNGRAARLAKKGSVEAVGELFESMIVDEDERRFAVDWLRSAARLAAEQVEASSKAASWHVTIRSNESGNEKVQLNVSNVLATAITCWNGGEDQPRLVLFLDRDPPVHPAVVQAYQQSDRDHDWSRCVAVRLSAWRDEALMAELRSANDGFIRDQAETTHPRRRWPGDHAVNAYLGLMPAVA